MRGIYKIELDGKCLYVGQSKDIKRRWTEHRRHLKQNKHENVYLQRIYNKYKNFQYLVVEEKVVEVILGNIIKQLNLY